MAEQILGRYVNTEASKGDIIFTRHITEVVRFTNDHIIVLARPDGEQNIRVGDNDMYLLYAEGFAPSTTYTPSFVVGGTLIPAPNSITTNAQGKIQFEGAIADLIAAGLPAPNPDGTSMLAVQIEEYRSEPVSYLP
jgi:hypothetical protein